MKLPMEKLPVEEQIIVGRLILEDDEDKREEIIDQFDQEKQLRILSATADTLSVLFCPSNLCPDCGEVTEDGVCEYCC